MSSPRASGEKKGTHSPKGYGGEEGQPGIAGKRRPVAPLLSHRWRGGPLFPPQCGAREGSPSPRYRGWEDNHGDVPLAKHCNFA